jgi:hypothetical protein
MLTRQAVKLKTYLLTQITVITSKLLKHTHGAQHVSKTAQQHRFIFPHTWIASYGDNEEKNCPHD